MVKEFLKRFMNYGTLLAFFAMLAVAFKMFGIAVPEDYKSFVEAFLYFLMMAGFINNPASGTGYKDEL